MRFLIDENLPFLIVGHLLSLGHDVLDVASSKLRGSSDEVLWRVAAEEKRIVVTRDLDFPIQGLKPYPPGLILIRVPPDFTAKHITKVFKDSFSKMEIEKLENKIAVISPGRIRISAFNG